MHIIVIAKSPVAGRVKTRLCPPYSLEQAAVIAEAALVDTLVAVLGADASARSIVLDGRPGPWLPPGFTVIPQRGDGLDARLAAAFADARSAAPGPILLVGMDTPQVSPDLLDAAAASLTAPGVDAVLGLAGDGGWWALGLHEPNDALLHGVPMSTPHTGSSQLARLREHGLEVADLPVLTDVDDWASANLVADLIPTSRFANSLAVLESAS